MATYTGDGSDNSYTGTADADQISGAGGNDTLAGAGGGDTIDGDGGDDALFSDSATPNWQNPNTVPVLDVGTEIDILRGLAGNDTLFAGYGDFVDGGTDYDSLFISFRGSTVGVAANLATLTAGGTLTIGGGTLQNIERILWVEGSQQADNITLPSGDPSTKVYLLGGDDLFVANGGVGEIYGGEGNDSIDAEDNVYMAPIYGEAGNDTILAGGGRVYGGIGTDTITGYGRIHGDEGNDAITATFSGGFYYGDAGDDELNGSSGLDILSGGVGADTIEGGGGGDTIYSATLPEATGDFFDNGSEHDVVDAGAGDDTVVIGYGDDADGGDGIDTLVLTLGGATGGVTLDLNIAGSGAGGSGNIVNFEKLGVLTGSAFADTIRVGAFQDRVMISGGNGADRLTATTTSVYLLGGLGNDILTGSAVADAIQAGHDNDTLSGGAGSDSLEGEDGDDVIEGGLGDDTIRGGIGTDTASYANASGAVIVLLNRALPHVTGADGFDQLDSIENVTGSGFDDQMTGDFRANLLEGGGGHDRLDGMEGADRLVGGLGNDVFVVESAGDTVVEAAGQGSDTVESSISYTLVANVETLTLTGSANINGTGNDIANVVNGNDGANRLEGRGGDDTLNGGDGDDLLYGGDGADTVNGGAGNDTAFVVGGTTNADTPLDIVSLGSDIDRLDVDYRNATQNVIMSIPGYGQNGAQGTVTIGGENRLSFYDVDHLTIVTGSGNDEVYGLARDITPRVDSISTGGGNDIVHSGPGAGLDRIDGGTGLDVVFGLDWSDLGETEAVVYDANVATGVTIGSGDNQRYLRGVEQLYNFTTGAGDDLIALHLDATLYNAVFTGMGSDTVTYHGGATAAGTAAAATVNMGSLATDDDLLIVDFASATQSITFAAPPNVDFPGASSAIVINGMTALNFSGVERLHLTSGTAADELFGGTGADRLAGGAGNDLYHVDQSGDIVIEAAGAGNDRVIVATSYVLGGSTEVETLEAAAGSAAINLTGNQFAQTLTGNNGVNILDGGGSVDTMAGLQGDDWYLVDNAGDVIVEAGGEGNDRLFASLSYALGAGVSVEKLGTSNNAGTGAINLTGNELAQQIFGNDGNNILDGKAGADILVGLKGNDLFYVDNAADQVSELAGQGSDRVFASVSYALAAGASVEKLTTISNTGTGAINLTGNELVQDIYGNDGANILDGKAGADLLVGLKGDDWFYVDNAADRISELAGEGNDRVFASVSYTLAAGVSVEKLTTTLNTGTTAINLTGNELVNQIYGNDGNNILDGKAGADLLVGLRGDDSFHLDSAADRITEAAGEGNDRLFASVSYVLAAGVSVEKLTTTSNTGTGAINLTGNELAQDIYGNDGNNILDGKGGIDFLAGLKGDDFFYVDNAGDQIQEAAGEGSDRLFASASYTLAAGVSVEKLTTTSNTGTGAINLTGNELANTIYGNDGVNVLDGKGGADVLNGLGGADTFAFTSALTGGNVDRIGDFQSGIDKIALDDAVFAAIGPVGALDANAFVTGAAAADAGDRIIYNAATGALLFDADGTGGAGAIQFATLAPGLNLAASDFMVI